MPSNKMYAPQDSTNAGGFFQLPAGVEVLGNIIDVTDIKSKNGKEGLRISMILQTPPFTNIKYDFTVWQSEYFMDNLNKIINHSGYKGQWNSANILIGRTVQLKTTEKINKNTGAKEVNVSTMQNTLQPQQPTQPNGAQQPTQQQPW